MPGHAAPAFSRYLLLIPLILGITACNATGPGSEHVANSDDGSPQLEAITESLDEAWGMDFLTPGQLLVTEKGGRLFRVDVADGQMQEIDGVPEVADVGQGGLLDVLVHPDSSGTLIYLSFAVAAEDGESYSTRITRARLEGNSLRDTEVLFTAQPFYSSKYHFGSRLLMSDGYLYATIGDRGNRDLAQDTSTHNGKVIRLFADGRVPADNPFQGRDNARPEIWTYGHRNPQGMAQHPDGSIWISEHGPKGGDELNRLAPGNNYGWPIITYGEEYRGGKIGEGTEKVGMEQPLHYYLPSIATAGIDFYQGDRYPGWDDSVLVAGLALTHLNRVELQGDGVGEEYRYFGDRKLRFRDVQVGPDGYVYVLAGAKSLYRIRPGDGS